MDFNTVFRWKKNSYLEYQDEPTFFRYYHDAYYIKFMRHFNKKSHPDFYGFYNFVSTKYEHGMEVRPQQVIPLSIDARYYKITEVVRKEVRIYSLDVTTYALLSENKIFDLDLPLAPECRLKYVLEVADDKGWDVINPVRYRNPDVRAYTVGGTTTMMTFSQEKKMGFKSEVYSQYELLMSSIIVGNTNTKMRVPYKTRRPNPKDTTRGMKATHIFVKHRGATYAIESFENESRIMINPITSHWFEFDQRLYVVYDQPGDFVAEVKEGNPPIHHINTIHNTYMEQYLNVGCQAPNVSLIVFVQSLAGTYQEFQYWSEHHTVLDQHELHATIDLWSTLDMQYDPLVSNIVDTDEDPD